MNRCLFINRSRKFFVWRENQAFKNTSFPLSILNHLLSINTLFKKTLVSITLLCYKRYMLILYLAWQVLVIHFTRTLNCVYYQMMLLYWRLDFSVNFRSHLLCNMNWRILKEISRSLLRQAAQRIIWYKNLLRGHVILLHLLLKTLIWDGPILLLLSWVTCRFNWASWSNILDVKFWFALFHFLPSSFLRWQAHLNRGNS